MFVLTCEASQSDTHLILYREIENGAEIVRVVHGARQWQKLFE